MAEYIDKEVALSLVQPDAPEDEKAAITIATAKKLIRSILHRTPAADVAPVVHGHWIIGVDNDDFDVKCSKCEWADIFEVAGIAAVERIAKAMHYCPNCGARMDGGANYDD